MVCSTSSSVCASDVKPACKVARQSLGFILRNLQLGGSCDFRGKHVHAASAVKQYKLTERSRALRCVCIKTCKVRIVQEAARPHTSYADGARYTPLSSMPLCQRPNLAMSALVASSKQLTGPFVKKNPNMPASNCHLTQDSEHLPTERVAAMESNQTWPAATFAVLQTCKMHAAAIYHVMCHNRKSPS